MFFSRSSNNNSKIQSPTKNFTTTPSLSHKKSHKTPKEKRRSSKTDMASPSEKGATQWYTSDSESNSSNIVSNGNSTIFELTQEVKQAVSSLETDFDHFNFSYNPKGHFVLK